MSTKVRCAGIKTENKSVNVLVSLGLYPFNVMVSFGESEELLDKRLVGVGMSMKDLFSERHKWMATSYAQYSFYPSGNFGLIRMKRLPHTSKDWAALQHEIFHIVALVAECTGLELKCGCSDEAYAYLISYLTEEIYEAINKFY